MTKITLIRPPAITKSNEIALFAIPPLGLAYVAGALDKEEGIDCQFIDGIGENLRQQVQFGSAEYTSHGLTVDQIVQAIDPETFLIGISCAYTKEWTSYQILAEAVKKRFPNTPIVVGGEHATAEPIYTLSNCPEIDYCLCGEGEESLIELITFLRGNKDLSLVNGLVYRKNGTVITNARRARITKINEIARPAWDKVPLKNYFDEGKGFGVNRGKSIPILGTRGCPFQCTFCSSNNMWTTRWVARDADLLLEEMEYYIKKYDVDNFDFFDLTAIVNKKWMMDFTDKLIAKNWNITWQLPSGTRAEAIDKKLCENLYKAGCRNLSFSPESGSPAVLKRIKKRISLKHMCLAIRNAFTAKLNIKANLILGFPGESHFEAWQTILYGVKMAFYGLYDLSIWSFAPYPGTELFDELKKANLISVFNNEYLDSISYAQLTQEKSWNPKMSVNWINFYRLFGMSSFYIANFLFRPKRFLKFFTNIKNNTQESRRETFSSEFFKTRGWIKKGTA